MNDSLNREDLQKIAETRLEEAKILFNNKYFDGARYLIGYVIEVALKARICNILKIDDYNGLNKKGLRDAFFIHDYDTLLILGGLESTFKEDKFNNLALLTNWSILTDKNNNTYWSESLRYASIGTSDEKQIKEMIEAVEDNNNGILTYIKKLW